MEILSQEQEQNQVQNRFAEQYADMERSQDNFYWLQMLKHLPEQIRGPVPNKKRARQRIRYLRSKRSSEIQRYLNAMRDWIGEREMRTENRRFQRFASIALSCLTISHLRRQPLSDTEQHVPAQVCQVRFADQPGTTPFVDTSAFPSTDLVKLPRSRLLAIVVERPSQAIRLQAGFVVPQVISTLSDSCIANLKRGSEAHD
jgi:hypothetical protein